MRVISIDEDKFQYTCLAALGIILILALLAGNNDREVKASLEGCPQVIDTIYKHCIEENNITITTIKGTRATLTNENGACIIK